VGKNPGEGAMTLMGATFCRSKSCCLAPSGIMQTRHSVFIAIVAAQLGIWPTTCPAGDTEIKAGRASINLELGFKATLNVERPFSFALIGDPRVIDFQAQGERSLLLKPLGLGTTNLVIVDKEGIVITNLTIVVRNAGPI
jgi:Flp pilus assembly secretin CpaC